jgi:hypothetical protein
MERALEQALPQMAGDFTAVLQKRTAKMSFSL